MYRNVVRYCPGQGKNSVMHADWLKTLKCDVMIASNSKLMIRTCRATVSKSNKWLCLQWLHARPTIIMALNFVKNERPVPCPDHKVTNYLIIVSFGQYQRY